MFSKLFCCTFRWAPLCISLHILCVYGSILTVDLNVLSTLHASCRGRGVWKRGRSFFFLLSMREVDRCSKRNWKQDVGKMQLQVFKCTSTRLNYRMCVRLPPLLQTFSTIIFNTSNFKLGQATAQGQAWLIQSVSWSCCQVSQSVHVVSPTQATQHTLQTCASNNTI